jgi:DNA topoisomerase-6 subunit B
MIPGVGTVHFIRLLARFRTPGQVLRAGAGALREVVGPKLAERITQYSDAVDIDRQERAMAEYGASLVSYGLSQSRGQLPTGPVTIMVHMASVWVPFTSESKEAIASYPEIQKELRLALQSAGRKLSMYLRRRMKVKQEGERRNVFLRYLGEVATAVSDINRVDRKKLYDQLLVVAKRKTAQADMKLDQRGRVVEGEEDDLESDPSVLIVPPAQDLRIRTTESTNGKKGS